MPLFVLAIVIAVLLFIIIASQGSRIKKLQKLNTDLLRQNKAMLTRSNQELSQLRGYLTQDPLGAYQLLETHVETLAKRNKSKQI